MFKFRYLQIIKNAFTKRKVQFKLPDLGEKATIKKWHVKEGDKVTEFQRIADLQTDKLFTQITSTDNGVISKIFHKQQEKCQVGEVLLNIDVEDEEKNQQSATSKIVPQQKKPQQPTEKLTSPAVRHLLKLNDINANQIKGTGKQGRILKQDVVNYLDASRSKVQNMKIQKQQVIEGQFIGKLIQMSSYQIGMQKSMTQSNKIPHLYYKDQVDITNLAKLRKSLNSLSPLPLTFMSFFLKSFSLALTYFPIMNSTYTQSNPFSYKTYNHHNISIAIDSKKGLVVPNIKSVQKKNIREVQQELQQIRKKGKQGKMGRNELQNGTICVSNIGTIGGTYVGPLIFPPQICIVAIGKTTQQPKYVGGELKPREIVSLSNKMHISCGCDHRVVDGATVARFCNKWKQFLQNPELMLAQLK